MLTEAMDLDPMSLNLVTHLPAVGLDCCMSLMNSFQLWQEICLCNENAKFSEDLTFLKNLHAFNMMTCQLMQGLFSLRMPIIRTELIDFVYLFKEDIEDWPLTSHSQYGSTLFRCLEIGAVF
jgi:hypothetical protein